MIPFPFTYRELLLAICLIAPEPEARQLAQAIVTPATDSLGWSISMETLILLSLVSPELNEKVDRFRQQYWPALDPAEWLRRREEMRRAVEPGRSCGS